MMTQENESVVHSLEYLNLLETLRILIPRLHHNLRENGADGSMLERVGISGVIPAKLPETDDEYLVLFFEMLTTYQMKKEDRFMTPDMLLALLKFTPLLIEKAQIVEDTQMLFVLFEAHREMLLF